jgi:hypothetical protein
LVLIESIEVIFWLGVLQNAVDVVLDQLIGQNTLLESGVTVIAHYRGAVRVDHHFSAIEVQFVLVLRVHEAESGTLLAIIFAILDTHMETRPIFLLAVLKSFPEISEIFDSQIISGNVRNSSSLCWTVSELVNRLNHFGLDDRAFNELLNFYDTLVNPVLGVHFSDFLVIGVISAVVIDEDSFGLVSLDWSSDHGPPWIEIDFYPSAVLSRVDLSAGTHQILLVDVLASPVELLESSLVVGVLTLAHDHEDGDD